MNVVGVDKYDLNESQKRAVKEFTPLPPMGGEATTSQPEVVAHSDTQDSNNTAFAVLFS